jgi:hypothetical protein
MPLSGSTLQNVVITSGFVPKGEYDNGTDYIPGDAVSYGGSSYIMYIDAVAGTLPTDSTKWMNLATGYDITVSATPPLNPTANSIWIDIS